MKLKAASVIILTLLLTGTLTSMFTTHLVLAKTETSEENTTLLNDDVQLVRNATKHAKEEIEEQVSILEHKVTTLELEQLKGAMGVWKESENYNQVINGHGTGLRPPTEDEWKRIADDMYVVDTVTYPADPGSALDLSATTWFPPIGNQDGEGSCTAWAVGYYVKTFQEAKEHGWDLSGAAWIGGFYGYPTPSYQNRIVSPDFIYHLRNHGVDAGSSVYSSMLLVSSIGACSWEKMPYDPDDWTTWPSEEAWKEAPLFRGDSTGPQTIILSTDSGIATLKNLIASQNMAVIHVDAGQYSGLTPLDFWTLDNYDNPSLNHANTVVGYDDDIAYTEEGVPRQGAFKIANSWGVGFTGEKVADGFYWISYEAMKQVVGWCDFYLDRTDYEPELVASFEISHLKRDDCGIIVGVGDYSSPLATKDFSYYVDGGSHPFCPNKILFDVTEFTDVIPTIYDQTYFLRVYDDPVNSATGTIISFAIEYVESVDPLINTVNGGYVYAEVLFSQGAGTTVSFTLSPNPASPGQTVELHGTLTEVEGGPVYPAQVKVQYSTDGWATWHYAWTLSTNAAGEFSTSFTAPGAGTYQVRVSYAGSASYNPSSDTETLLVGITKVDTVLDFSFTPNPVGPGETVQLSGTLKDVSANPVYPAQVVVEYSTDGGATWHYAWTLNTNAAGQFSQTFTAPGAGVYLVRVRYAGSASYNPSSHTETLTVGEVWGDYHFRINPYIDVIHIKISGNVIYGIEEAEGIYSDAPLLGWIEGSTFYIFIDFPDGGAGYELAMLVGSTSTLSGNMYRTVDGTSWVGPTSFYLTSASSASGSSAMGQALASAVEPQSWPPSYHFRLSPWIDIVRLSVDGSVIHGTDESAGSYSDQPVLGYVSGSFVMLGIDWTVAGATYEFGIIRASTSTMSGYAYRTTTGKSFTSGPTISFVSVPP